MLSTTLMGHRKLSACALKMNCIGLQKVFEALKKALPELMWLMVNQELVLFNSFFNFSMNSLGSLINLNLN